MDFDLEKAKTQLAKKIPVNCKWVFHTDLCILQKGRTRYWVSLDDKEVQYNQPVVSIRLSSKFESAITLLESIANVGGSVINGLGQSYNSLVQKESENFVLNVYKYY